MRPGADTSSSHAATTTAQGAVGSQPTPNHWAAAVVPSATQVSHRSPVIVRSGTVSSTCATCERRDTGRTVRSMYAAGVASSSSATARSPIRGWS